MRQLLIQVPPGQGKVVLEKAQACDGKNLAWFEATSPEGKVDIAMIYVSNQKVEHLLKDLEGIPQLHITLVPRGFMPLQPPAEEAPEQVTDVQARSPIEVFLAGLQSVGSWRGFLGYAALAGVVVWIGLYTNTSYLLTASMLIAPFAGPAMNVAIATARGDGTLLKRSLIRYFSALLVTIATAALLSLVLRQEIATSLMLDQSQISAIAVLLPLVAGAAGALQLVQSERSSLVSGAAVGMLVAASLAPPAGIVGIAIALGRWEMVVNGVFLVLLQLVGINLSATLILRLFGLSAQGARYNRGKKWMFPVILSATAVAIAALLTWQFSNSPNLQRSSRAQRVNAEIQKVVENSRLADLVETNVRFTRANISGQNTLLCVVYVQRRPEMGATAQEIRDRLTQEIQNHLRQQKLNAIPLVDVSVLDQPTPTF